MIFFLSSITLSRKKQMVASRQERKINETYLCPADFVCYLWWTWQMDTTLSPAWWRCSFSRCMKSAPPSGSDKPTGPETQKSPEKVREREMEKINKDFHYDWSNKNKGRTKKSGLTTAAVLNIYNVHSIHILVCYRKPSPQLHLVKCAGYHQSTMHGILHPTFTVWQMNQQ